MSSVENPFATEAFKSAKPQANSVYFEPGIYPRLRIEACKLIKSSAPGKMGAVMFVTEFTILESNVGSRPAGSSVSWVCNFAHPSAPGNVKGFMGKILGEANPDKISDKVASSLVAEGQIAKGTEVSAIATQVPTKKGGVFTQVVFTLLTKSPKIQELLGG